jgi:hypothetical protein
MLLLYGAMHHELADAMGTSPHLGNALAKRAFDDATTTHSTIPADSEVPFDRDFTGIRVYERPPEAGYHAGDIPWLELRLEASIEDLSAYEWIEGERDYRQWLIPVEVLNALIRSVRALTVEEAFQAVVGLGGVR